MFPIVVLAVAAAEILHLIGVPGFADQVSVPITGLVAMCAIGVLGRIVPKVRVTLVAMVPPRLPNPLGLVLATGIFEFAGAIGVIVPETRAAAAACLFVLLLAIFPANVRDAHRSGDADATFPRRIVVRGAQQVVFLALAVWVFVDAIG